jgi:hypothetical protein
MEAKLFTDDVPFVSTFAFHEHRARAPHLEQAIHRGRLQQAADFLTHQALDYYAMLKQFEPMTVIDLGCGDGGLLQLLSSWHTYINAMGYDFQPSNADGWRERGVRAYPVNFVEEFDRLPRGDAYNMTEVLEHLQDPHGMLRRINLKGAQLVCSSPWTETYESHDECHAWAWDMDGYAAMIRDAGFTIGIHVRVGMFQVVWATP